MANKLTPEKAKQFLIDDLVGQGFEGIGVLDASDVGDNPNRLKAFIDSGYHGSMDWMVTTQDRRSLPKTLWADAKSIAMVAMNYSPAETYDPLEALKEKSSATISCYAHHRDYHDVIKGKLKQAAGRFAAKTGAQVKIFVDTAPVMEKPLAQSAGLGWQGKHTNLVSRELGSWFFLGSIFTDMALPIDGADTDHCGTCRSCLDICPTDAFPAPYQLDARRCISYLTIEHAGPIDHQLRKKMGNRVYGCDDCLAVCPWNKFAQQATEAKLHAREELLNPPLSAFLELDDTAFRKLFSGSPVKRIGRDRFIRNCLIAAGNSEDIALIVPTKSRLDDDDPVVRGAAVWALGQLVAQDELNILAAQHTERETDDYVNSEWKTALGNQEKP